MSKTMKRCYYDKLTFDNLYNAYIRASKSKRCKKEVINFELNLETNLIRIYNDLYNLTYIPSKYRTFTIYEPKERVINALPFYDRVIHQFYVEEFIKPFYVKRFINDTYACIENRGTHSAVLKLQYYLKKKYLENNDFYILKCDIKKFFFNINRDILFNIISKDSKDKYFLELSKIIIYSFDKNYIPIGNYTSQYYANIYLNELDHFIKDMLNIKYYIRYMDDFILVHESCDYLKEILEFITKLLKDKYKLELNKKTRIYKLEESVEFLGFSYKLLDNQKVLMRLNGKRRKRFLKNMKNKVLLYKDKKINKTKLYETFNSYLEHISKGNNNVFANKIRTLKIYKNVYVK